MSPYMLLILDRGTRKKKQEQCIIPVHLLLSWDEYISPDQTVPDI